MRKACTIAGIATLLAAAMPIAASAAETPSAPACTTPPVSAPAGRFCGLAVTVEDEAGPEAVDAYEGIRYGTARRWTAPRLAAPASALVRATAFGPICPQAPVRGVAESENCLFLNIWTPTRNSARNLPVMLFIYGGSFTSGAGQLPVYNGARLSAWGNVVVVTFNYRLGALGFLAGGSGADRLAGNYGFEDQQLALEWIHKNIGSFGGDPAKVTIFGESAGAMSVGAHLVSPGSLKLFKNAIMESNPYGIPFKTPSEAKLIRQEFDETPAAAACNGSLACLERLPAARIVEAQGEVSLVLPVLNGQLGGILAWAPFADGRLIAGQPNRAAISRPVIAGTNRDEGPLFVDAAFPQGLNNADYALLVGAVFKANAPRILATPRYRPNGTGNLAPLSDLVGDYFFSCATRHVLRDATGAHFGYAFDHPPSFAVWPQAPQACQPGRGPNRGQVCHTFELPFVFRNPITVSLPTIEHHFTSREQRLVDAISAYWADFAVDGDPNSGAAAPPEWPAFGASGVRQVLNLTISRTEDTELDCPLWDGIGYDSTASELY